MHIIPRCKLPAPTSSSGGVMPCGKAHSYSLRDWARAPARCTCTTGSTATAWAVHACGAYGLAAHCMAGSHPQHGAQDCQGRGEGVLHMGQALGPHSSIRLHALSNASSKLGFFLGSGPCDLATCSSSGFAATWQAFNALRA